MVPLIMGNYHFTGVQGTVCGGVKVECIHGSVIVPLSAEAAVYEHLC